MSLSRNQLIDFAKYVDNHEALGEFIDRVNEKIFNEFASARSDKERLKAGHKFDALTELVGDIKQVLDEMKKSKKDAEEQQ